MKFKVGDKVQIIGDSLNEYPEYIGYFAKITSVDDDYGYPYELEIYDINNRIVDECISWEEENLQLATPELIEQRAEENLKRFKEIDDAIVKATEYAGITKEQGYKFMEGLNLKYNE